MPLPVHSDQNRLVSNLFSALFIPLMWTKQMVVLPLLLLMIQALQYSFECRVHCCKSSSACPCLSIRQILEL